MVFSTHPCWCRQDESTFTCCCHFCESLWCPCFVSSLLFTNVNEYNKERGLRSNELWSKSQEELEKLKEEGKDDAVTLQEVTQRHQQERDELNNYNFYYYPHPPEQKLDYSVSAEHCGWGMVSCLGTPFMHLVVVDDFVRKRLLPYFNTNLNRIYRNADGDSLDPSTFWSDNIMQRNDCCGAVLLIPTAFLALLHILVIVPLYYAPVSLSQISREMSYRGIHHGGLTYYCHQQHPSICCRYCLCTSCSTLPQMKLNPKYLARRCVFQIREHGGTSFKNAFQIFNVAALTALFLDENNNNVAVHHTIPIMV